MSQFRYVARTATRDKVSGTIEAPDRESAISAVEAMGHFPISVSDPSALASHLAAGNLGKNCRELPQASSFSFFSNTPSRQGKNVKNKSVYLLLLLIFVPFLFSSSLATIIGKSIGNALSPSNTSPQHREQQLIEGLNKAAAAANRRCPFMVDNDTRMDRMQVGPGARVTYFHSFPNHSSADVDPNVILVHLRPDVTRKVCASKAMRSSLRSGVTYVYAYRGNDNVEIARFDISKDDCDD